MATVFKHIYEWLHHTENVLVLMMIAGTVTSTLSTPKVAAKWPKFAFVMGLLSDLTCNLSSVYGRVTGKPTGALTTSTTTNNPLVVEAALHKESHKHETATKLEDSGAAVEKTPTDSN